jgi:hypothetical protein
MLRRTMRRILRIESVFDFTRIPEALNAVPSHMWLTEDGLTDRPLTRSELRAALRRAEAHVSRLRVQLNPES